MRRLVVSRFALLIPVLFVASVFVFLLVHLMPVDPAVVLLGEGADQATIEAKRAELGLDEPLTTQYVAWLSGAVQGEFGDSLFARQAVSDMIAHRAPITISLSMAGIAVALVFGLSFGVFAARRVGSWADRMVAFFSSLGLAIPSFWLGLVLAVIFAVWLGWLPAIGYTPITENAVDWVRALILPGFALGVSAAAVIARQTRAAIRDASAAPYVTALRSQGVSERRIMWGYVFKNAMIPILAIVGIQVPIIVGGTLVVEQVFSQAGLGTLLTEAVLRSDAYVLQGGILTIVVFVLLLNLILDIAYGVVDPRVRSS